MAKNTIKYRDFRVGAFRFTVKLTYLPGVFDGIPWICVDVMEYHSHPHTWFERVKEFWTVRQFNHSYWVPDIDSQTLDQYCIEKCQQVVEIKSVIKRAEEEWAR